MKRRKDGEVFVVRPERTKASPLDVPALDLRLTRKEIVKFVHAGRRPAQQVRTAVPPAARKTRRAAV